MAENNNNNNGSQGSGGINLLPDELRRLESEELKRKTEPQVEYRSPKESAGEPSEGKVPWFSFRSWFGRDKTKVKKTGADLPEKERKPKLIFRLLGRGRQDQDALEQVKEETIRQKIISEVFQKKGLNLPENDNALFNEEQRRRRKEEVSDLDIDAGRPLSEPLPTPPPVPPAPVQAIKLASDLPTPPPVPPPPIAPEASPETPTPAPPVPPPPKETPEPVTAKKGGFHIPTFKKRLVKRDEPGLMGVNLIPTLTRVRPWSWIRFQLIMSAVITMVVLCLGYGGLFWWEGEIAKQTTDLDGRIQAMEAEILKFETLKDEISLTESQIKDIETLLGKHVYWTRFFALLEKYTIDDVYFDSFSAGLGGSLGLSAHGKNFMSAARQLRLLQQDAAKEFVTNVSVTGVSQEEAGVSFGLDLELNDALFKYHASSTEE